jgi:hypothetical protein
VCRETRAGRKQANDQIDRPQRSAISARLTLTVITPTIIAVPLEVCRSLNSRHDLLVGSPKNILTVKIGVVKEMPSKRSKESRRIFPSFLGSAWFSPRIDPASKLAWTAYGGRVACADAVEQGKEWVSLFFGAKNDPDCPLVNRRENLELLRLLRKTRKLSRSAV